MPDRLTMLALLLVLGAVAQWAAWRLRLPSILLLLGVGYGNNTSFHLAEYRVPNPPMTTNGAPVLENGPAQCSTSAISWRCRATLPGSSRENSRASQSNSRARGRIFSSVRPASTGSMPRCQASRAISSPV